MKLLKQPTDYTCGQTSVAMVANVPVDYVRKIMKKGWNKKHWFGEKTSTKDLVRALRVLGVSSRRKLRRKKEGESLPNFCIIHLVETGVRWGHWAVHRGGRVYDPYFGLDPEWPKGIHVSSYLEIL